MSTLKKGFYLVTDDFEVYGRTYKAGTVVKLVTDKDGEFYGLIDRDRTITSIRISHDGRRGYVNGMYMIPSYVFQKTKKITACEEKRDKTIRDAREKEFNKRAKGAREFAEVLLRMSVATIVGALINNYTVAIIFNICFLAGYIGSLLINAWIEGDTSEEDSDAMADAIQKYENEYDDIIFELYIPTGQKKKTVQNMQKAQEKQKKCEQKQELKQESDTVTKEDIFKMVTGKDPDEVRVAGEWETIGNLELFHSAR